MISLSMSMILLKDKMSVREIREEQALYNQDGVWVLAGVNSFTAGDCESYFAGAARVDQYIDWIDERVEYFEQSTEHPFQVEFYPSNTEKN